MVSTILKVLSEESSIGTTPENFNGKTLIRVYNNTNSDQAILVKNSEGTNTGSFTLKKDETVFVRKLPAENIAATANVRMVPVAF